MPIPLKFATASQEIPLGYFLDSGDGDTEETGLTVNNTDIKLWKAGATTLANKNSGGGTHIASGIYYATLDTTDTDTYGPLIIFVHVSGSLALRIECWVMNADAYDALFAADGTGHIEADIVEISGAATPADNLELQFDTTGLTGDTFPANQAQVGNIATGAGGLSALITAFAKVGAEPETNTFTATQQGDGTYHIVEDDGGNTDFYYQATVSAGGKATSFKWTGYVQSNGDTVTVWYWDWSGSAYKQITTLNGANGTTPSDEVFTIPIGATGTGTDQGKVRLRFLSTTTTAIATDRLLCEFSQASQSAGYADGAIWVNTNASNTNTVDFVDGVADNPVSTWAAALTLSTSLKITRFHIINGSSITLSASIDGYTLIGDAWDLALNGQSIARAHISGADVTGVSSGVTEPEFHDCHFGAATIPPAHLDHCGTEGTFTLASAGTFFFDNCHGGGVSPVIDFGSGLNASTVYVTHFSGRLEIQNMGAGSGAYVMRVEGDGEIVINANCSATSSLTISGNLTITDNAGGAVTVSDDARIDVDQINAEADQALTDYAGPTKAEMDTAHDLLATEAKQDIIDTNVDQIETAVITNAAGTDISADIAALPTAAQNADAVFEEPLADHDTEDSFGNVWNDLTEEAEGTYRFTAAALIQGPTVGSPGSGALTFTYTLLSSIDSTPITDAEVWVTSDQAGTTVIASGTTDTNGQVVFYLDSGTIYVWRSKAGWNFDNPDTEVVS